MYMIKKEEIILYFIKVKIKYLLNIFILDLN